MTAILTMIIRRLLILILGQQIINQFLGPELVEALLGDGVVGWIVSIVGTLALVAWSSWEKLREKARLQAAVALPMTTTVQEVKEKVAEQPISETITQGLKPEK